MIFSILSSFVTAFSPKECFLRPYLLGLIEMTTGIREMARSEEHTSELHHIQKSRMPSSA